MPRRPRRATRGGRLKRYRASIAVLLLATLLVGWSAVGVIGNVASAAPSSTDWLRLRVCESGNNYAINTGNGYYGAYQFDLGTWRSVGGNGYPHQASPATQDALALKLWQQRGWRPWACASIIGLSFRPADPPPSGALDSVTYQGLTATVRGWALDSGSPVASIGVHIYVNGVSYPFTADNLRSDVNRVYGVSGNHGFSETVPLQRNRTNEVCVWAIGVVWDNNSKLGCRTVAAAADPPRGALDSVTPGVTTATVRGWTFDPGSSGTSTRVDVSVNGVKYSVPADKPRSDVNRVFGIAGNHGFVGTVPLRAGVNSVCVTAVGTAAGNTSSLRCVSVTALKPPRGHLDSVVVSGLSARVAGWTFDPNSPAVSSRVQIYVNGVGRSFGANRPRADVNRVYNVTGQHGFIETVPLTAGSNSVCVFGIGLTGSNILMGCRTVTAALAGMQRLAVIAEAPTGVTAPESAPPTMAGSPTPTSTSTSTTSASTTTVPETTVPKTTVPKTTVPKTTVPKTTVPKTTVPGLPTTASEPVVTSSESSSAPVPTTGAPASTVVTTPTVPASSTGGLDPLVLSGGTGPLTGWIAGPATSVASTWVRITVNGVTHDVLAAAARPDRAGDAAPAVPLGFTDTVTLPPGTNEVCLFEIDSGGGISTAPIVCRTEVVG